MASATVPPPAPANENSAGVVGDAKNAPSDPTVNSSLYVGDLDRDNETAYEYSFNSYRAGVCYC